MVDDPRSAQRPFRLLAVLAVIAMCVLAACGGGGGDDDAADPPSGDDGTTVTTAADDEDGVADEGDDGEDDEDTGGPCDMVSDEVVAEVLGIEVVRREPHEEGPSVSCIKGTERLDDVQQGSFVSVGRIADGAALVDAFSAEAGSVSVDLGDRAVYVPSAGVLSVALGEDVLQVQVFKQGTMGTQDEVVTVAEDVISRL